MIDSKRTANLFAAAAAAIFLLLAPAAPLRAQQAQGSQPAPPQQQQGHDSMPGMDMGGMPGATNPEAAKSANDAMSDEHMDMGPHMHMTVLRPANPADEKRAAAIVVTVREAMEKYKDYKVALADGFEIFHPEIPQPQYHFTKPLNAFEASFEFNPSRPTSLLYKKTGDGYELVGAMFTAPRRFTEDELNERVPLSVARWHEHVNFCLPPLGARQQQVNLKQFGMRGTIATEEACHAAGGHWIPQVFGWMVHVYPYETDPDKIWAH